MGNLFVELCPKDTQWRKVQKHTVLITKDLCCSYGQSCSTISVYIFPEQVETSDSIGEKNLWNFRKTSFMQGAIWLNLKILFKDNKMTCYCCSIIFLSVF